LIILVIVIIIMKFFTKFILDRVEKRWWFTTDTKKNRKVSTRTITRRQRQDQPRQHPESNFICSDTATNELTSTFQGSLPTVTLLSFLYGSVQYLAVIFNY
jgi:hypothetical protein